MRPKYLWEQNKPLPKSLVAALLRLCWNVSAIAGEHQWDSNNNLKHSNKPAIYSICPEMSRGSCFTVPGPVLGPNHGVNMGGQGTVTQEFGLGGEAHDFEFLMMGAYLGKCSSCWGSQYLWLDFFTWETLSSLANMLAHRPNSIVFLGLLKRNDRTLGYIYTLYIISNYTINYIYIFIITYYTYHVMGIKFLLRHGHPHWTSAWQSEIASNGSLRQEIGADCVQQYGVS